MADVSQSAPRARKKLACGATSCGGCVKECGVVVYKYIAGLDMEDNREDPIESSELTVLNS
jgi:hypothetical protein